MTQTPLQRFLMERFRNNPIDRNEHPAVARLRWRQIRAAYAHLVDRANAWDDQKSEPEQLSIAEDVSGLYGPPIVHPAGEIPREVEQAVAERIAAKRVAAELVAATQQADELEVQADAPTQLGQAGILRRAIKAVFG